MDESFGVIRSNVKGKELDEIEKHRIHIQPGKADAPAGPIVFDESNNPIGVNWDCAQTYACTGSTEAPKTNRLLNPGMLFVACAERQEPSEH